MKLSVVMPQLGESITEGQVLRWLKRAGETVQRDEALVEIKTDKATIEIPAPSSGTLTDVLVAENSTVPVGAALATIESTSAVAAVAMESAAPAARRVEPPVPARPKPAAVRVEKEKVSPPPAPAKAVPPKTPSAPKMTPLARRVAAELGVDPATIAGTGEGGRITREDVLQAKGISASAAQPQQGGEPPEAVPPSGDGEDEIIPFSPLRRRIAARLVQSSQTIPQVTTAVEADMTAVSELRTQQRESYEGGIKLTYLPFIMKAAIDALKAFKVVNASWGGENLLLHRCVHLGVAVSVEGGLVVPVIRNADAMTVRQLAGRLNKLAEHARAGKLSADEVQGGTFTITNPGAFGSVFSTPLVNPPEAAILGVCRIAEAPVVREGKIVIRSMTNLCLSYDHRIIDGETALKFLQHMRATLEAAQFPMQ